MLSPLPQPVIAIVGGGVSGALTAYHLARRSAAVRVVVIDPRPELGLGLAYSTPSLRHLLNVPAGKISALPDDPDHFLRWLTAHHDPAATAETFAPRAVFGRYVRSLLADVSAVEHRRATAVACRPTPSGATLTLDDGTELSADHIVLATGNFDPAPLRGVSERAIETGVYRHNAWADDTYDRLAPDAAVTLVGTGLTAVDVLLRLRETGHRGPVTAVSRHGVFPARHHPRPDLPHPAVPAATAPTCLAYLRALRATIATGVEWRSAVDSLRAVTNDLWLALPTDEQRRFKRHLQRRWDVVRHRMAPTIADALDAELTARTLLVRHGHLTGVDADGTVTLGNGQRIAADRVINCTGPSMDYRRVGSPLLDDLFARGLARPGPLGGGLWCDVNGALIDTAGKPSTTLFNLGPARLGTLLESIAVPELRQQADALAITLAADRV
jgi:hydroxyacylglutathione hydrolase